MTASDLMVGAAFADHALRPGRGAGLEQPLTSLTAPWNTLAVWHVPTLARVCFVGVAEGLGACGGRADGGVDDVTAIAPSTS